MGEFSNQVGISFLINENPNLSFPQDIMDDSIKEGLTQTLVTFYRDSLRAQRF